MIGLMCKAPVAGHAKTRLAATLGAPRALALATAFLLDGAALAREVGLRCDLATMAFTEGDVAPLLPGWDIRPQPTGDLGTRMGAAFAAGVTLLLGTDSPTLPPGLAELALAALHSGADAAVVPALDGGFCALAMARPLPALLMDIAWSTDRVLAMTLARAAAAGLRVAVLQPWHDVDTEADLALLRQTLDGAAPQGCSTLPPWRATATRAVF